MKINKRKPSHWWYLVTSTAVTLAAVCRRRLFTRKRQKTKTILLYGHKFNGNLKALYEELTKYPDEFRVYVLTIDRNYYCDVKRQDINVLDGTRFSSSQYLADATVIISDHGLHGMELLIHLTNIKFIDVWHGIPFKGFDSTDFRVQHNYSETWVTSLLLKKLYTEKFGFDKSKVVVTGYARTDRLVNLTQNVCDLKQRYHITDSSRPVILFAPTWAQDTKERNLYPFGLSESEFLNVAQEICHHTGCYLIVRHHLNSQSKEFDNESIVCLPSSRYPDTEDILLISDMLVCDWSSIAFDYLALNRPTLFLDVPPPFAKGFSLTADYRFGPVIENLDSLKHHIVRTLHDSDFYWSTFNKKHQEIRDAVYDQTLDGQSAHRGVERLRIISCKTASGG